jgi:hypothetical protein
MANELWLLAQVSTSAITCGEICEVLLLLGTTSDFGLACDVQKAMDLFADAVRSHPAKVAPMYVNM